MKYFFIGLIKIYQRFISPLLGPNCRHVPTCSNYGVEAYQMHGVIKGSFLTLIRVLKCNPFGTSGYDPVPEEFSFFKKVKN